MKKIIVFTKDEIQNLSDNVIVECTVDRVEHLYMSENAYNRYINFPKKKDIVSYSDIFDEAMRRFPSKLSSVFNWSAVPEEYMTIRIRTKDGVYFYKYGDSELNFGIE